MRIFHCSYTSLLIILIWLGFDHRPGFQPKEKMNYLTNDPERRGNDSLVVPGAVPMLVSNQFSFTEGPAVDKKGNIFFTDQPNDKIWKYGTDGKLSVFLEKSGRSNGLHFDGRGNLLACADEKNELWSVSPNKKITILIKDSNGKKLNGPNDLWVHPGGTIYFTDTYYQRSYWTRKTPDIEGEKVYLFRENDKIAVVATEDVIKPNGIVGSPDGKYLYVADIGAGKTYRYTIEKDGSISNRQLFTEQGSDGITLDSKGNLYLTGDGVTVYNPAGEKILHIPVPAQWTSNVCFGGKDRNILFITASESVYTLAMIVKGVE
jgi:gluconolactonase